MCLTFTRKKFVVSVRSVSSLVCPTTMPAAVSLVTTAVWPFTVSTAWLQLRRPTRQLLAVQWPNHAFACVKKWQSKSKHWKRWRWWANTMVLTSLVLPKTHKKLYSGFTWPTSQPLRNKMVPPCRWVMYLHSSTSTLSTTWSITSSTRPSLKSWLTNSWWSSAWYATCVWTLTTKSLRATPLG